MLALALLAAAAAAQPAPPPLGRDLTIGGQTYAPQLSLLSDEPYGPIPGLYRRAEHDWRARRLQSGPYPAAAFAARREGTVGVRLVVDATGRLAGCTVMRPSGEASLDRHACPHLTRYAAFHPALDDQGRRVPRTFDAHVDYRLIPTMESPAFAPGDGSTAPSPRQAIDAAALGISAGTRRPPNVDTIITALAVGPDGRVTACTLAVPTYDDALDRQICDRARTVRFEPARDRQRRNIAGAYQFAVRWPGAGD